MEVVQDTQFETVEDVISKITEKKPTARKKAKKVYEAVRVMNCDRCGQVTAHTLFNYETKVYKCNICGSFHTKRNY